MIASATRGSPSMAFNESAATIDTRAPVKDSSRSPTPGDGSSIPAWPVATTVRRWCPFALSLVSAVIRTKPSSTPTRTASEPRVERHTSPRSNTTDAHCSATRAAAPPPSSLSTPTASPTLDDRRHSVPTRDLRERIAHRSLHRRVWRSHRPLSFREERASRGNSVTEITMREARRAGPTTGTSGRHERESHCLLGDRLPARPFPERIRSFPRAGRE